LIYALSPKEREDAILDSWDVFEHTSDDRIDYKHLIDRINNAVSADAK